MMPQKTQQGRPPSVLSDNIVFNPNRSFVFFFKNGSVDHVRGTAMCLDYLRVKRRKNHDGYIKFEIHSLKRNLRSLKLASGGCFQSPYLETSDG